MREPRERRAFARALSFGIWLVALICLGPLACTPRVEVAPSDKPITINLNVKIDHEIRVKVDKDLENVMSDKSGLF
ncbi:MAG: YnbE family lipoprotein [Nitrospiraceae bacterium]